MTIQLYLARHASPDWTRKDIRYDIPPGPELTREGESEAEALGHFLSAHGIQSLYSSPLERARQTALLAGAVLGLSPIIDHAVAEWTQDETVELVADRIVPFWQRICAESEQRGPICVVTHGGPLAYVLVRMGLSLVELNGYKKRWADQPVPPGGLWSAVSESYAGPWKLDLVFTP